MRIKKKIYNIIFQQLDKIEHNMVYNYDSTIILQKLTALEKLADISTKINDEVDMACVLSAKDE